MSALPTALPISAAIPGVAFAGGGPRVPVQRTDRRLPDGRLAGASPETLETVARQANRDLEGKPADDVIAWAVESFGNRFCVTSSMQDLVLSHIASKVAPGLDVVFLDTGYHFAETIGTRDAVDATMDIRLINVRPTQTVAEQDATLGAQLHDRNPELCCQLRKVAPLRRALERYDAYATGVRRAESAVRSLTPVVRWDPRQQAVKISPLVEWTDEDVTSYIEANGVLVNPLMYDGYPSVGCAPCTTPVAEGEDSRSGRWAGRSKTECGLHA